MKVRNFAFFGVMASILGISAANAASDTVIASQAYVDAVANTKQPTLQNTHITDSQSGQFITDITAANGQITVTRSDAPAVNSAAVSAAGAEMVANKETGDTLTDSETKYPSSHTVKAAIDAIDVTSQLGDYEKTENKKNETLVTMDEGQKKIESVADYRQIDAKEYAARKALAQDFASVKKAIDNKQDTISDLATIRSGASAGATAVQPATLNAHVDNSDIHVTASDKTTWSGKQDAISDLATIRSGAAAGATAVQPNALNAYEKTDNKVNEGLITVNQETRELDVAEGDDKYASRKALSADFTKVKTAIDGKQDVISDLATIRSGASAGATAVQPATLNAHVDNSDIHVTASDKTTWSGKQDAISDLDTIRSGAAAGATAEQVANRVDTGLITANSETHVIERVAEGDTKYASRKALSADFTKVKDAIEAAVSDTSGLASRVTANETSITNLTNNKQNKLTSTNVTTTGTGNAITAVSAADGVVTVTKNGNFQTAFDDGSTTGSGEAVTSVTQTAGKVDATKTVLHYNKAMEYKLPNYTTGKTAEQFVASECSAENPCVLTIVGMDSNGQPNYEWTQMVL